MGLIPEDVINEIRARTDIVSVIGEHVQLRKAGANHKGLCPFHNEKTPSFNVNGPKGFFYCFGCQKKGDVFTFVMEYEGKSFIEVARQLAERAGVEIPQTEEPEAARRHRSERARMFEANRIATEFYRAQLAGPAGAAARDYLAGRGINAEISAAFQLGYAPSEWRALGDHLTAKGVDERIATLAGLVIRQPRRGGVYDRFRDRVMCPVIVPGGEIAGFSGRRLSKTDEAGAWPQQGLGSNSPSAQSAGAKYINSPESPVYKKSKLLFGLHRARDAFHKTGRAILVEGNFDVISLHQAGFTETVAALGTALTDEQVGQLRRLVDTVVLVYDGDEAGRAATLKALRALVAADVEARIATLPPGQDPDSVVQSHGAEGFAELVERAQPGVEYFAFEVWAKHSATTEGRSRALGEAAEIVATVQNPTKRDLITGTLASAMGLDVRLVRRAMSAPASRESSSRPLKPVASPPAEKPAPTGPPPVEELEILAILADHPHLMELAEENSVFSLLTDARLRDMYCAARRGQSLVSALVDDPVITKHVLAGNYVAVKDPAHTLRETVASLVRNRKLRELARLQKQVEVAQRRGDVELERKLVREILTTRRQVD